MLVFDCVDDAPGDAVGDCILEYAFSQVKDPTFVSVIVHLAYTSIMSTGQVLRYHLARKDYHSRLSFQCVFHQTKKPTIPAQGLFQVRLIQNALSTNLVY